MQSSSWPSDGTLSRLHFIRHVPYEGLGVLRAWASARGVEVTESRPYAGDALPDPARLQWVVVLGGPMGAGDASRHPWMVAEYEWLHAVVDREIPVLGICLGAQMLARALGGRVERLDQPEIGWQRLEVLSGGEWLKPFAEPDTRVLEWHFDSFVELPPGARQLARAEGCEQQAFCLGSNVLALQFHPEFTLDEARRVAERDGAPPPGRHSQSLRTMLDAGRFESLRVATFRFLDDYAAAAGRLPEASATASDG